MHAAARAHEQRRSSTSSSATACAAHNERNTIAREVPTKGAENKHALRSTSTLKDIQEANYLFSYGFSQQMKVHNAGRC
jgi:hypothetical protein